METLLDEAFLRRLETLKFLAQKDAQGRLSGIHKSIRSGSSMEFMDYRKYQPGDDIRYVDWHVFGRSDRLFIKLFHAEKELTLHILIDTSASMQKGKPAKLFYAKKIAAALSYLGLAGQDQVGLCAFNESLGPVRSPKQGKDVYLSIVDYLAGLQPSGETLFNQVLETFAASGHKPGVAVVISDLLLPGGFEEGLKALVYSKFKTSIIQVLDPDELNPTLKGRYTFKEVETGREKSFEATRGMKKAYVKRMQAYLSGIRAFCKKVGIDYHLAETSMDFENFFLDYLGTVKI